MMFFVVASWVGPTTWARTAFETRPMRGLKADVAHLLFSTEEGGGLALAVLAVPGAEDPAGTAAVTVLVEVDGQSLLEHHRSSTLPVEFYAYAVTSQGTIAHYLAQSLTIDPAARGEARSTGGEVLAAGGLKFQGLLDLPAGDYQLRVLVRHASSGAHGLRILALKIPSTVPLFPDPPQRWTQAMAKTGRQQLSPTPAARPVLAAGRQTNAFLPMAAQSTGRWRGRAVFTSSVEGPAGHSTAVDALEPNSGGLPLHFRVPRMPPGEYLLQFELKGSANQEIRSIALPVLVVKEDTPEQTLLWTDLRWQKPAANPLLPALPSPSATPSATTSAPTASPRVSRHLKQLAASYRASLLLLSGGDLRAARSALLDVESAALGRGKNPLGQLRAAEEWVHLELAKIDAEGLVPVLALHLDLYRAYVRRKLHSLVGHSRTTVQHLAKLYIDRGGTPEHAANALSSLAFDLYTSNLLALGLRLSKDALAYDGTHRGALLSLAIGLEKGGDYRGAATVLERLTETHPGFPEARLRLAVNLERVGQSKGAEPLLTALVEDHAPGWIGTLANLRLARRLLATGRAAEASDLLAAASVEHPREAGLKLLWAHLEDRRHRGQDAYLALHDLAPQPERPSPVWSYDSWPWALFEEINAALDKAAQSHRKILAGALAP